MLRIVDIKCPSSGHAGSFLSVNFHRLVAGDECKFVLSDKADFFWALDVVRREDLPERVTVLFSPNMASCGPKDLAAWIIEENAPVRLGVQLHKFIWGDARGVSAGRCERRLSMARKGGRAFKRRHRFRDVRGNRGT